MKAKIIPIIAFFPFIVIFFISCEDTTYREYEGNSPVYLSYSDLRTAVSVQQNVGLENPGKIYYKDNFIFIVEELKGIHVYDNTDPSSPVKKGFVRLPGVIDISISGNILYADSFVDLVMLNVQDINNISEAGRVKDILPYTVPATGNKLPVGEVDIKRGVVIAWEVKTIREKVINYDPVWPVYYDKTGAEFLQLSNAAGASSGVSGSGTGFGGSMARFGIKDNVLYIVDQSNLKVFDITDKINPVKVNDIYPGWNIETMFLSGEHMFLGTTTGIIIFNISNPLFPSSRSFFSHATSCDPVIVDDTLAYVTLRSGNTCGGTLNCLDVINIKNINAPSVVKTVAMKNPHGLGKSGDLLFICDGSAGLKIYDASDPAAIENHLISAYSGINAYDVIPLGNILVMIGDDGLYQYNYSDIQKISLLSTISVEKD